MKRVIAIGALILSAAFLGGKLASLPIPTSSRVSPGAETQYVGSQNNTRSTSLEDGLDSLFQPYGRNRPYSARISLSTYRTFQD